MVFIGFGVILSLFLFQSKSLKSPLKALCAELRFVEGTAHI